MTRQRLREGSIKWETQLSLASFSQKIIKKSSIWHSLTKVKKIIKTFVPEKVKIYVENNLSEELKYFQKNILLKLKYCLKINL